MPRDWSAWKRTQQHRTAALLAARAALAAGAGRVHLVPLDPQSPALDPMQPELMHRPLAALHDARTPLANATVVCGCGGGDAVREHLPGLIARAGRLLLDADALNAVAADPSLTRLLELRASHGRATLLTPHPLEAARLLGLQTSAVQSARLSAADRLVQRWQATVVLKGSGSVIAAPGEITLINASGMSVGMVVSSNMVSTDVDAAIKSTGSAIAITGDSVTVAATDDNTIEAETTLLSSSTTTNDGGASLLNKLGTQLQQDYAYSSVSGTKNLKFGDKVRVASTYTTESAR